jgi:hypothetical protein
MDLNHGPLQKPQSLMDPKTKSKTTNHGIEKGPFQKPKFDGSSNKNDPPQKQTSDASKSIPMSQLAHFKNKLMDQKHDITQTQVFFPGSDYTSYKVIGGKSQILTARILSRQKSRRRIGKP